MHDPFSPIAASAKSKPKPRAAVKWTPVTPIPADAPARPSHHPKLGAPSKVWTYRDADGREMFHVFRFDGDGGKEIRPLSLHRNGGVYSWRWQALTEPRPIYREDELKRRPRAPVVIVEGEKSADAAQSLLPDYVATTSANGSKSAGHSDWSAVKDRKVVLWPDADAAGHAYSAEVSALCYEAGAASVALCAPPEGVKPGWDAGDALAEKWTPARAKALMEAAQPIARPQGSPNAEDKPKAGKGDASKEDGGRRRRPPQRDAVIGLAEHSDLWRSPENVAYITFPVGAHRETWRVDSKQCRTWLRSCSYKETGTAPSAQTIEDAIRFLESRAIVDGPERKPLLRVGEHKGNWYLDLCDPTWSVIEIRRNGWEVLKKHDIPFRRTDAMKALPSPEAGALIEELRGFVNAADDASFIKIVAWTVAALVPDGPYPILAFQGEEGSGKSSLMRLLRSVIDPNVAPIRAPPKDESDLIVSAKSAHTVSLDNISKIEPWLADALCRISTGGGFSTRTYYTNDEEFVVYTCNPVMLNGIPDLTNRSDLASRTLLVRLQSIADEERRSEREFWCDWEKTAPRILGALCDALSTALRRLPETVMPKASRMADFDHLILAAAPALGWEPEQFLDANRSNRRELDSVTLQNDVVAQAIISLVSDLGSEGWQGTATRLLAVLNERAPHETKHSPAWPKTPESIGARIERLKPPMRRYGILIEKRPSGERFISIRRA